MRYLCTILVALSLSLVSVFAQQNATAKQTFGAGIELVEVDVSVLDKDRRPVRGLQISDFTVLEDDNPRPIAAFASVDLPARPAAPKAKWMHEVASDVATNNFPDEGRLVVILMDRSVPVGLPALTARTVARAAIDQLAPGDLAAVVYTGSGAAQDFTGDRARLV